VLWVVVDDRILTYVQEGVPANRITIPSFNVPLYAGVRIIKHADEDPEARLPQVKGGMPSLFPNLCRLSSSFVQALNFHTVLPQHSKSDVCFIFFRVKHVVLNNINII
jgi:hypothetical protein